MRRFSTELFAIAAILLAPVLTSANSSAPFSPPGVERMQLASESESITPGKTFSVGLYIKPAEGFHTYWKHPGIVGVPTGIEWTLPEGFHAGPIQWPAPILTKMAALGAYGYESEHLLVVDITAPELIRTESVTISAKATWMACARSCHPGSHTFALTLPVNHSGQPSPHDDKWSALFRETRSTLPHPTPKDWDLSLAEESKSRILLTVRLPSQELATEPDLHFFSYDNQVDSDEPQDLTAGKDGSLTFHLYRPEFAPKNPEVLAGVLYHPGSWPGTESKWIEIAVPWRDHKPEERP